MNKIRILGIAPYEGLKNLLELAAASREHIELHTIIADKSEALDYIANLDETLFDAIISRGGTATSIRELVTIPVFDILISYYDIFNILKLAESLNEKYCMICYPSLAAKAENICRVLDYDVKTYVTNTWAESQAQVTRAINDGYEMILGDVSACRYASSKNAANMLITTGIETVEEAFQRIDGFFLYYKKSAAENLILRNYVTFRQELLIVYDSSNHLTYSSVNDISPFLKSETRKLVASVRGTGSLTVTKKNNRRTYFINASRITIRGETYCQFIISFRDSLPKSLSRSISITADDSDRTTFFSYLYSSPYYRRVREQTSSLIESHVPILITGPRSVGKEDLVRTIFTKSHSRNRALFFVDCQTFSLKELESLIESVSSPLHDNNCTFCFNYAQALDLQTIRHLLSYCSDSNFHKRNRVIFSWQTDTVSDSRHEEMLELTNKLGCSVLNIPSLRQMPGVIPKLAALYINDLNTDYPRQIFGISPEAASLLQGYDWPFNLDQLRRVIREAYLNTDDPYIGTDSVRQVLEKEKRLYYMSVPDYNPADLSGTLEDITRRIIMQVYQEENHNQSKTAARLGISRTTLWRMMK